MNKSLVIMAVSAVLLVFVALPAVKAYEVPCEVVLAPDGEPQRPMYASVAFNHGPHVNQTCKSCHHMFEGCGEITACRECHFDREDKQDPMGFYAAWHSTGAEGSCLGCHKAQAAEGNEAAPIRCAICHPRPE